MSHLRLINCCGVRIFIFAFASITISQKATLIPSHLLSCVLSDVLDSGKCLIVHTVNVLNAVMHLDRNLLPRDKAEVTLLKQGLQLHIRYRAYRCHDVLLKLHEFVHVLL